LITTKITTKEKSASWEVKITRLLQ
jgi:hypothetical protein